MYTNNVSFKVSLASLSLSLSLTFSPAFVSADGMFEDRPKAKPARVVAPVVAPVPVQEPSFVEVKTVQYVEEPCGCTGNMRLSGGVPVYFFEQESANRPAAGMALDYWCDEMPVNFRVGVEGRHMWVGQGAADYAREAPEKTARITYIRIPFAVEYMTSLGESTTGYIGGGPDIINTANDFSETGVGMHISGRLHYAFTNSLGVSLEAGYMWGSVDAQGDDHVDFNNAFVTPMLAYTF